ncbi:MAG: response regulator [Desulfobacterales bacterium]
MALTLTVLAVEDDAQQRRFLESLIRAGGHRVFAAETAGAALRLAAARAIDLAVLDVFLPDGTALELIPGLRAFRPGLPVVTVTGENSRELELALRRLGIVCYLAKPIRSGEFLGLLDHLDGRLQRDAGGGNVPA